MPEQELIRLRGMTCVVTECGVCGVVYTVPKVVYDHHYQEGGYHHCPNGHSWGWAKDGCERERLRRERDLLKQQAARLEDEKRNLRIERDAAVSRETKERKERLRITKRTAAGVCPNCNRTFKQLARHMATKHALQCNDANPPERPSV